MLLNADDRQTLELSQSNFDNLVHQGKITCLSSSTEKEIPSEAMDIYTQGSEKDLEKANERYRLIQPYLKGQSIPSNIPQERPLYY